MSDDEVKETKQRGPTVRTKKLLTRIKNLENELKLAQAASLSKLEEIADLEMNAFCFVYDQEERVYKLVTVAFDLDTGLGKVTEVKKIADSYARMVYEGKKMLAENKFLQGDK